jgi:hypothetical protein
MPIAPPAMRCQIRAARLSRIPFPEVAMPGGRRGRRNRTHTGRAGRWSDSAPVTSSPRRRSSLVEHLLDPRQGEPRGGLRHVESLVRERSAKCSLGFTSCRRTRLPSPRVWGGLPLRHAGLRGAKKSNPPCSDSVGDRMWKSGGRVDQSARTDRTSASRRSANRKPLRR